MHQHLGSNGRRKLPPRSCLFLQGGVGADDGFGTPPDYLGNAPLLVASNPLNLSVELVWKLYLRANHMMIIQRLNIDVNKPPPLDDPLETAGNPEGSAPEVEIGGDDRG